jgi:hypothetical protein
MNVYDPKRYIPLSLWFQHIFEEIFLGLWIMG